MNKTQTKTNHNEPPDSAAMFSRAHCRKCWRGREQSWKRITLRKKGGTQLSQNDKRDRQSSQGLRNRTTQSLFSINLCDRNYNILQGLMFVSPRSR